MKAYKPADFAERRNTAAAAKKQLLEKLKSAPKPDDPALIANRAEKAALAAARSVQRAERDRLKREAVARQKVEEDARALAEATAARIELDAQAERSAAEQAEKKAERDRRYAARKNRKR